MLVFNETVRLRIGNVIVQYHLVDVNSALVITFPPGNPTLTEQDEADGKSPWAFDFLSKQRLNVISFAHIGNQEYYLSTELGLFIEKLSQFISIFPERLGYGVSRGGFALAKYGDKLSLDRALLLMPVSTYYLEQASLDPRVIKAQQAIQNVQINKDASGCQFPLTIVYDPLYLSDRLHLERFSCEITKLKLPGVGHQIPRALQDLGILKSLVADFIHDRLDLARFPSQVRKRKQLFYYYKSLASNPTGKLTFKRKRVIQYHKLLWKLKNIDDVILRLMQSWRASILKRIPLHKITLKRITTP